MPPPLLITILAIILHRWPKQVQTRLHQLDRLLARIIFYRGHPRSLPLAFHEDAGICRDPNCRRRHY